MVAEIEIPKIGFIGGGEMTMALIKGFIKTGLVTSDQIFVSVRNINSAKKIQDLGCNIDTGSYFIVKNADIIFLVVNPKDVKDVLLNLSKYWENSKLLISVCAGLSLKYFTVLGFNPRVIWLMPNISCMIQTSASLYCCASNVGEYYLNIFQKLLSACGEIYEVDESQMNAATALNSCGIAYMYMVMEALCDAGVKNGLSRDLATKLIAQTALGGAQMVKSTGVQPAVLKDQITTRGGATIAALATLEEKGLRHALISAVDSAYNKIEEINKTFPI